MADKDNTLITLTPGQTDPGSSKASDFTPKGPKVKAEGMSKGDNQMLVQSHNQESPRSTEDGHDGKGYGIPAPMDRGAVVARNFPSSVNKGESNMAAGKKSAMRTLDLVTGQLSPNVEKR